MARLFSAMSARLSAAPEAGAPYKGTPWVSSTKPPAEGAKKQMKSGISGVSEGTAIAR